jgi:hypothetical protein
MTHSLKMHDIWITQESPERRMSQGFLPGTCLSLEIRIEPLELSTMENYSCMGLFRLCQLQDLPGNKAL